MPAPFITTCSIWPSFSPPPGGTPRSVNVPCRLVDMALLQGRGWSGLVGSLFVTHYLTVPGGTTVNCPQDPTSSGIGFAGNDYVTVGPDTRLTFITVFVTDHLVGTPNEYRRVYMCQRTPPATYP